VRVPDNVKLGKARVTFSFDAWKEGRVASSTWEFSVVKPEKAPPNKAATTGASGIEACLKVHPWDRESEGRASEFPQLGDLLEFMKDRYDLEFRVDAKAFGMKDKEPFLRQRVELTIDSRKDLSAYLNEWLEQVGATYAVKDTCILIIPRKKAEE
jgi:hypothetical protein